MDKRDTVLIDFEDAMKELFTSNVKGIVTAALRMEFPGIEVLEAAEDEHGVITFTLKEDDRYTPEQIENFLDDLRNKVAVKKN